MMIQEPERQRSYIALVGVKLGGSRFGSSRLKDGVRQKDLGTQFSLCFRSIVKDQIVWYAQVHNTHTCFKFHDLVFGFGLTDLGFHEQIVSKQVYII